MWLSTVKPPVKYEEPPFPALRKQSQRPDQKMRIKTAQWNPLVDSHIASRKNPLQMDLLTSLIRCNRVHVSSARPRTDAASDSARGFGVSHPPHGNFVTDDDGKAVLRGR